ncbi:MAG: CutA1 divalent ion tolerance protein [Candidatus Curtissbacteria bacterium GW2011_GWA1_41_11]|uniref:CutA1 divalent ion tolerance protein n=1 Tax=Candidatus Curtissbacteria bacterium GW2011_GWA1_41_11 TaxID=1618409 RepID=A0A0G0UGP4_9BACT|nr:MAG: CutA1 divalent ion tolerance protein [Candidatus Curtissbacteria bacterium GW2011_GWA1_41_11]
MILILTTFQKKSEAVKIGKDLLKKRVIACYNLIPVESVYWWKGKIEEAKEFMMILKAQKEDYRKIESIIIQSSSYETPEVISVKPDKVNKSYLDWISAETK